MVNRLCTEDMHNVGLEEGPGALVTTAFRLSAIHCRNALGQKLSVV